MERSLLVFVWRHAWREQLVLVALTLAIFPFVYASLEVPKIIVNDAINGVGFPREILGQTIPQIPYLLLLCGVFLLLVVIINGLKWLLNVRIGMSGERMLRRLRYQLFEHVMRIPVRRFRAVRSGETVQAIMGEVEPLGGFIGEVTATPIFQGGLLTVYVLFIFVQDVWLGLAAVALYPVQAVIIPMLQRRVIRLNRERAANARELADRIGEGIGNIADVRLNGTTRWHLARIAGRLHVNTRIRQALFKRKFTIKFITNFLNQLTPFAFYAIGGYLVIRERLDFGALVAVLAAYKDLAGPWKALLAFMQRWTDFNSRFRFVVDGFTADDLQPAERLQDGALPRLRGDLVLEGVVMGKGADRLTVPDLRVAPGETLAVTGGTPDLRETALHLMAGLAEPDQGRVMIGDTNLQEATFVQLGAALAHVGAQPGMVAATIRENALYGLLRCPPEAEGPGPPARSAEMYEAVCTGNIAASPDGDWVAYEAAGVADAEALDARLQTLIEEVGLSATLTSAALARTLPRDQVERWREALMAVRAHLAAEASDIADLVEPWQAKRINRNGTVLANLLFATLDAPGAEGGDPMRCPVVAAVLKPIGAVRLLEEIGWDIVCELEPLAEALDAGSPVLDRLTAFGRQDLTDAAAMVARAGTRGRDGLSKGDRARLRDLAAKFVPVRDQLDVLGPDREARILDARARARPILCGREDFVAFDAPVYNPMRTVADNILDAPRRFERRSEWPRLDALIDRAVQAAGLSADLVRIGLAMPIADADLPPGAVRRVGLLRALVKRPAVLVLDGFADGDSPGDRRLRATVRAQLPGAALVYAAASAEAVTDADMSAVIDAAGVMRKGV